MDLAHSVFIVANCIVCSVQVHWQHYTEPSAEPLPATATVNGTVLPLGQGTLTHNSAGVPIVVVCTKADLIDEGNDIIGSGPSGMGGMVKGKGGEWEERTDSIMQVLRTVCLKCRCSCFDCDYCFAHTLSDGAGLFYTTPQPATLQVLRQYALHTLFMPPAPSPAMAGSEVTAPPRNPFPFLHKPNALDRDKIVVPAGWDSWGKIGVLRDGFDPKLWGEGWENDLDGGDDSDNTKATRLYANLVPDLSRKVRYLWPSSRTPLTTCNSPHLSLPLTIQLPSRSSLRRTMTRTRRTRTATPVVRSAIQTRPLPPASSVPWAAAASTFRTWSVH